MNAKTILSQYWRLTLVMMFPARYVRWLGVFTLMVLMPGAMLSFFGHPLVLHIGSAISLLLLMMMGMLVPGQMLALRSSKQFQYMADLRYKLFFIALGFWLLTSLILTGTLGFLNPKEFSFYSVFALTTMALSCVAVLFAVVGSYMQTAQGFIPMVVWFLFFSTKSTDLFSSAHIEAYWLITMGLWLGMYIWWFRWQPQKYLVNFMTLSASEMQRQQASRAQAIASVFSAVPKTLPGSLILGLSDGVHAWWKRELGQLIFFLLFLILMLYLTKQIPVEVAGSMVSIYLFIYICVRGGIIFQNFFRNLYRVWMSSIYSRAELLTYAEKHYFLLLISSMTLVMLIFALINHYVLDDLVGLFKGVYLFLIGFLFCSLSFYLGFIIYIKCSASFLLLNWISPIVNIALVGLMVYFNILFGSNPSAEHTDYLAFSAVLVILILLGRAWVKYHWSKINFFRVKN